MIGDHAIELEPRDVGSPAAALPSAAPGDLEPVAGRGRLHRADRFRTTTEYLYTLLWQGHLSASVITRIEGVLAFAISALFGALIGFWLARHPLLPAALDPYIKMLNALPRVVLAPIFLLWLGLGIWPKVALGVSQERLEGR